MSNSAAEVAERSILLKISPSCHIWRSILGKISIFRKIAIFGFLLRNSAVLILKLLYLTLLVRYFALQSLDFAMHVL